MSVSDSEALEETLDLLSTLGTLKQIAEAEHDIDRGESIDAEELRHLMHDRSRAEQGCE